MIQISYVNILTKAVSECMKCTRGCNYPVHWLVAFVVCSNVNLKKKKKNEIDFLLMGGG